MLQLEERVNGIGLQLIISYQTHSLETDKKGFAHHYLVIPVQVHQLSIVNLVSQSIYFGIILRELW